jgi:putative glycosyltransferase
MKLSIVTTLYKSRIFLDEFLIYLLDAISFLEIDDFEIVFVNDGSPDDSLNYLVEIKANYPQIKIIDLSRNFGHHYAMQVGMKHASGEYIFLIDNDLEVNPSFLIECYNELMGDARLDVVYGFQENRKGKFTENIGGLIFWNILNKISDVEIPKNMLTERLMRKQYLDSLLTLGEYNLFLGGMMYWVGFNQKGLPIKKSLRQGASTYSLKKRAELMLQAITSFSGKPLVWLFYFGFIISFLSILFISYLVIQKTIYQDQVEIGWTSVVAINVLILGVISTFLGIIGIYIFKIFSQVQGRPNAIIKRIYE